MAIILSQNGPLASRLMDKFATNIYLSIVMPLSLSHWILSLFQAALCNVEPVIICKLYPGDQGILAGDGSGINGDRTVSPSNTIICDCGFISINPLFPNRLI